MNHWITDHQRIAKKATIWTGGFTLCPSSEIPAFAQNNTTEDATCTCWDVSWKFLRFSLIRKPSKKAAWRKGLETQSNKDHQNFTQHCMVYRNIFKTRFTHPKLLLTPPIQTKRGELQVIVALRGHLGTDAPIETTGAFLALTAQVFISNFIFTIRAMFNARTT